MEIKVLNNTDVTHMAVYCIQGAIREALRHFKNIEQGRKRENYEKYSRPVCFKLMQICTEQLNQLEEKERFFPNQIKTEQDLKNMLRISKEEKMDTVNNGNTNNKLELPREPRFFENNSGLPQTGCNKSMPKADSNRGRTCLNCIKEDVCTYKDECMKAVKDISDIKERANVFIETEIRCKKWNSNDIHYRGK